jgi:hypothetical protein
MKALALLLALLAGGAASASPQTLKTAGPVTLLAADGPLAAAVVRGDGHKRCTQIVLWKPGGAVTTIQTGLGCDEDALFEGIAEIALGGKRVLWQETNGGNNLELIVNTATLAKPKRADVSYVENGNGAAGDPGGPYTGHLLGDGPLLVFAAWTRCDPYVSEGADYAKPCKKGEPVEYDGGLHQVAAGRDKVLRSGDDMLYPMWVDGGRILVGRAGPKLMLLRTTGATLRTFDVGPNVDGAVFQGSRLVVLRPTALDVYDTGTGARTHTYPLAKTPRRLVDLQSGIAVLISAGAVRLIQVDTGKGATVKPSGGGTINSQLEPTGLYTSSAKGLTFIPMAQVLARFG